jgi:predicted DNA-binding transcriptional regulator AlpA
MKITRAKRKESQSELASSTRMPSQRFGDRGGGDDDDGSSRRFVTGPMVLTRYGVTDMSLHRWLNDPDLNFPKPAMVVRGRRYWLESELIAWERSQLPGGERRREREVA